AALSADRRTLHLVAEGLAGLYDGGGEPAEPAIQYADFSQWQNELLETDDDATRAAREHWAGIPFIVGTAPFGGLTEAVGTGPASLVLEPALVEKIERFCAGESVEPRDFFLASWQTVLARATGEAEIVTEELHPGRKLDDLRQALGPFAKALPTLGRFDGNVPFAEAVKSVAEARRVDDEWEEYYGRPEDLEAASEARARRTGFEWVETPPPVRRPVTFSVLRDSAPTGGWPLWLACVREGDSLRLICGADATPAARAAAARLVKHLDVLVRGAAGNPVARAGELPLLGDEERRKLLIEWNRTAAPFSRSRTIHELFEEQARRTPDAPAVVCGSARLSYSELNSRADTLAGTLSARGVRPGIRVGLALDRSVEVFVAMMAILKAGGAYVPLNPDHPDARLAIQLAQCEAPVVVTSSAWVEKFSGFAGRKILMDGPAAAQPADASVHPAAGADASAHAGPDDTVYVMYTSGSTGVPKGVAVRHQSLVNYAEFVIRLLGADRPLAFATVSTISADLGNTAIFPSLLSGGTLHVIDYQTAMEGDRLAAYVAGNSIDVLKVVPSHLAALLSAGGAGVLPRGTLVLGGEALSWDLVDRIRAAGGTCRIVNHYGPTEATVGCLTYDVTASALPSSRTVPVGRPIANAEVFVLDPAMSPVPVGVAGELYVGGTGIAAEYVNQPAETAQKFVANPFGGSDGGRLYRTGDRVRHHPSGDIEFLGRVDDQVKIRGFRIEPGEAQAALAGHPAVSETFVAVREDSPGEPRLVAYVVAKRGGAAPADELRTWLKARLPDYMIPSAFVSMNSLPLTPNGKVDRRALPAPEQAGNGREYVAPATPAEVAVARIWSEVLRIERVGSNDNFFELGGHSLLVTQVVSRMRKAFQRDLPIRWVFESPTVAELAARTAEAENADVSSILDELEGLPDEPDGQEVGHEPPVRA
ncbi:MAG: amino acid adenylation domain-containing protein, partial [Acidobacteria bacterium]|nr:amino acid adenylation domain-containing protein [Acidobacteriota bacterium]